jgi:peptidoglycan/xylan/chitin deacetylase (PgdA/CDA1 family)
MSDIRRFLRSAEMGMVIPWMLKVDRGVLAAFAFGFPLVASLHLMSSGRVVVVVHFAHSPRNLPIVTIPLPQRRLKAAMATLSLVMIAACAPDASRGEAPAPNAVDLSESTSNTAPTSLRPDPRAVRANELGEVPVLMYHRIVDHPESEYERSPQQFRAELERLVAEDYVPVTVADFAMGHIDIPAGKHPVVLTFDDGDPSQLSLGPDGRPTPNSGVGVLLDVAAAHPGFRPVGSLYVNAAPFGAVGGAQALAWLWKNGFDIGNHTFSHASLGDASADEVQREIAHGDQAIQQALPGYRVTSIALPFGASPQPQELAMRGAADGVTYDYRGVLLVGAGPAPSPYCTEFDPLNIPRIRSQDATGEDARYGSTAWLDELAATPGRRYTSDGDVNRIAYPADIGTVPAEPFRSWALAY